MRLNAAANGSSTALSLRLNGAANGSRLCVSSYSSLLILLPLSLHLPLPAAAAAALVASVAAAATHLRPWLLLTLLGAMIVGTTPIEEVDDGR